MGDHLHGQIFLYILVIKLSHQKVKVASYSVPLLDLCELCIFAGGDVASYRKQCLIGQAN